MERLDAKEIGYALHTGDVQQRRRREEIRRFKEDPDCRVFLASESGGVGLNLQAASVVVNLDMPWNPAKLEQRLARLFLHDLRTAQGTRRSHTRKELSTAPSSLPKERNLARAFGSMAKLLRTRTCAWIVATD